MPSYSPTLFAEITDPFLLADMRGLDLEPEYCVGNSHAFTVAEFDDGTAECACGDLLREPRDGEQMWAEVVHDATGRQHCPPYSCRACCRVHNLPSEGRYLVAYVGRWSPIEYGVFDVLLGRVVEDALSEDTATRRATELNAPYLRG